MDIIDLRSDTVTHPTPAMREAMANAVVGDDVLGDDPTVKELEAEAAAMFGKEAGLFVSSGTQGNLVSIMSHCQRGDEVILGKLNHIFRYEQGGAAAIANVMLNTLPLTPDATLDLDEVRATIRGDDQHFPVTRLVCVENTHNAAGGVPVGVDYMNALGEVVREHGLKLHVDGARIFNAAAALNTPVAELTSMADSVTFCLSKGLSAPVGSVIVGSEDFIARAFRVRKVLGGGMRQVGVLAAAGLVALREMPQRLHEDHENARLLAEGLAEIPCIKINVDRVKTNMLFIELTDDAPISSDELVSRMLRDYNVKMLSGYGGPFRLVTHYWIKREHVEYILSAMRALMMPQQVGQRP